MDEKASPYRKAPPPEILKKLTDASNLKLYLQQDINSTYFIFREENRNRIKVSIGPKFFCSSCAQSKDNCLHILYVLLKIFKLNQSDPRLWQTSYLDSDIEDFLQGRYSNRPGQKMKIFERTHKRASSLQSNRDTIVCRKVLSEKDLCPICHDNMRESEGIAYCSTGCGVNFHMKCLLIWAENPHNKGIGILCPWCRRDNGSRAHEKLLQEFEEFKSRDILHKEHRCGACKSYGQKCIKGKLFHCLNCENFELCEKCFLSFEHFEHTKYLVKETVNSNWKPAQSREVMYQHVSPRKKMTENKKHKFAQFDEIDQRVALLNMNLAGFEDHFEDKLVSDKLCIENELTLEEFIVSCFPEILEQKRTEPDKESTFILKGLLDEVHNKSCFYCTKNNNNHNTKFRRLFCGHLVHNQCLMEMIAKRILKCPEDGSILLKGLASALAPKYSLANSTANKQSGEMSPKLFVLKNEYFNRFTRKGGHQIRKIREKDFSINGTSIVHYNVNDGDATMMLDKVDLLLEKSFQNKNSKNSLNKFAPKKHVSLVKNLPRIGELGQTNDQLRQTMRLMVTKRPYISSTQRDNSHDTFNRSNVSINTTLNVNDLPIMASTIKAVPRLARLQRSVDLQRIKIGY